MPASVAWAGRSRIHAHDDLFIMEEYPEPPVCRPERLFVRHAIPRLRSDVTVNLRGSVWELELDFGQVQPGAESWTADELIIGALDTMEVLCRGNVVGNNCDPIWIELVVRCAPTVRDMTVKDL